MQKLHFIPSLHFKLLMSDFTCFYIVFPIAAFCNYSYSCDGLLIYIYILMLKASYVPVLQYSVFLFRFTSKIYTFM